MEQMKLFSLLNVNKFSAYAKEFPTELFSSVKASKLVNFVMHDKLRAELHALYKTDDFTNDSVNCSSFLSMLLNDFSGVFPEIEKLLSVLVTLSVSSCGCERSFSALKRIKTFLRTNMSDDRLCNLSFLSIQKELIALMIKSRPEKWHTDVIDNFASSERRIDLKKK